MNKEIGNCSTAELLSTFCDNIMKTGGDKIEGEIDTLHDKIVMLFSYLSDKVRQTWDISLQIRTEEFIFGLNCRICLPNFIENSLQSGCFWIDPQAMMMNALSSRNSRSERLHRRFSQLLNILEVSTAVSMWCPVHIEIGRNVDRYECFERQSGRTALYHLRNLKWMSSSLPFPFSRFCMISF